jgi:hypothetical protein
MTIWVHIGWQATRKQWDVTNVFYMREIIIGKVQRLVGVYPILTTNLDELDENRSQNLK